jgi:hypothetical protein
MIALKNARNAALSAWVKVHGTSTPGACAFCRDMLLICSQSVI